MDSSLTKGSGDGVARGMSEREVRVRGGSVALTERDSSSSKIAGFIAIGLGVHFEWSSLTAREVAYGGGGTESTPFEEWERTEWAEVEVTDSVRLRPVGRVFMVTGAGAVSEDEPP